MVDERAHLRLADRHIREGRARIADLEAHIVEIRSHRWPTELAEKSLAAMRQTLKLMIAHREIIRTEIERQGTE